MIQRGVKIQILVFAILGALFMTYAGASYVGFNVYFNRPYKVTAYFTDSGGIFSNAAVTERGVTVGKVGSLKLTNQGVAVQLILDKGTKVAQDSKAIVANLSFAGEQYVDIQPQVNSGPMMKDGSIIPASMTSIPISDADFLVGLNNLVNSVPQADLRTVVSELGKATNGLGPTLAKLIRQGNDLTATVTANLPQQLDLIQKGQQVLDTANSTTTELKTSSKNFADLLQQLLDSDKDIQSLLKNGTQSATSVTALLRDNEAQLPVLLGNLITLGQIQDLRLPALRAILVIYPEDIRNGFYNAPGDGTSHFGGVFDQSAPVCTAGYSGTHERTGEATPSNVPANTAAGCNLPSGKGGTTTTDIRGSRNAPRPPGDITDPALKQNGAAHNEVASSTASTSCGLTFSPPETIVSALRPSTVRRPSASSAPRSPVASQPSGVRAALGEVVGPLTSTSPSDVIRRRLKNRGGPASGWGSPGAALVAWEQVSVRP